ncbi:MAG: Na+:solute symporter [Candidatus Marinimicrobia bacterium]|nr:Na+:solute symporter [Candidatus Neomarinimicrobiota bacterium]
MLLSTIDWVIIFSYFLVTISIGLIFSRKAGKNTSEYFLSGRNMPWWLLGVSMVATTFSADTPNLVTDIVRQNGVYGNWVWWGFLLTGMLTVFVFAKLWRRSSVLTDLEFYEIRYSGKPAAFLRGFRAVYLGLFLNVMIMATVSLAFIKICGVILEWSPIQSLLIISLITVIYSSIGGLKGVIITDFFQFIIAMVGSLAAAIIAINLPEVGGLESLLNHPNVLPKLDLFPDLSDKSSLLYLLIIPLTIQWWSVWYPGAEPGGGGYIAQRMLSAKNENQAVSATLLFNVVHYAIRPWPWILVGLASLVIYPDIASLQTAFPHIDPSVVKNDLAYPAMLTFLPKGLLGVVLASLIAAFMSTISTHLNWGASYIVHDIYGRFINPSAGEKRKVLIGRIVTVFLMIFAGILALFLENALQAFHILIMVGAGTGLIFILRWFWWRINAFSEISAMIISFTVAIYFNMIHVRLGFTEISPPISMVLGVGITTLLWIMITFVTPKTAISTLVEFYKKTTPGGPGWKPVLRYAGQNNIHLPAPDSKNGIIGGLLNMLFGSLAVFSILFSTGYWIYGEVIQALIMTTIAVLSGVLLYRNWQKHNLNSEK